MNNLFQKNIIDFFRTNPNEKIDFYESLYIFFLVSAIFLLFFIILNNLNVLILFKYNKTFITFFVLLIAYSVSRILYLNSKDTELTRGDKYIYMFNILSILVSSFAIIYLSGYFT